MTICKVCKFYFLKPIYGKLEITTPFPQVKNVIIDSIDKCKANAIIPYSTLDYVRGVMRWTFDGVTFIGKDHTDTKPEAQYPQNPYLLNSNGHCPLFEKDPAATINTVWGPVR